MEGSWDSIRPSQGAGARQCSVSRRDRGGMARHAPNGRSPNSGSTSRDLCNQSLDDQEQDICNTYQRAKPEWDEGAMPELATPDGAGHAEAAHLAILHSPSSRASHTGQYAELPEQSFWQPMASMGLTPPLPHRQHPRHQGKPRTHAAPCLSPRLYIERTGRALEQR